MPPQHVRRSLVFLRAVSRRRARYVLRRASGARPAAAAARARNGGALASHSLPQPAQYTGATIARRPHAPSERTELPAVWPCKFASDSQRARHVTRPRRPRARR